MTILSHPADTMMGLLEFGENLTQDTHSVCPSSCWWTKDKSSLNMSVWGNVVLRRTIGHRVYFLTTPLSSLESRNLCIVNGWRYSGSLPYHHPWLKKHWSFYYFKDPVNTTISLLWQGLYGPTMVTLKGLHCIQWFKFPDFGRHGGQKNFGNWNSSEIHKLGDLFGVYMPRRTASVV